MNKLKSTFMLFTPIILLNAIFPFMTGCSNQYMEDAYKKQKVEEKNKAFIIAYTDEFWNRHNIEVFDSYFSDDFKMHATEGDKTREEYRQFIDDYFRAFPDLNITIKDLIADEDKVVNSWMAEATHQGEFMGIAPTGNKIESKGIEIFRIENGKIAELWECMDNLGMLKQLGAIPESNK